MRINRLHYISQPGLHGESHSEMVARACAAGVRWVQLRIKDLSDEEFLAEALKVQKICTQWKATFIVNDRVHIASEIDADGVHVGQTDCSVMEARGILGTSKIIGGTAHTREEVEELIASNADYVGLGPFRFTTTKENLRPSLGIDGYRTILETERTENVPIIGIGGILPEDVKQLLAIGVHGVAVAGAINRAKNQKKIVESFRKIIV